MRASLGEVLRDPDRFPWNDALYAAAASAFAEDLPVLVHDPDDVDDDVSDLPSEAAALGYEYVLGMQTVQSIVRNARQQRPEASTTDLLDALDFYYSNDAFIVWP